LHVRVREKQPLVARISQMFLQESMENGRLIWDPPSFDLPRQQDKMFIGSAGRSEIVRSNGNKGEKREGGAEIACAEPSSWPPPPGRLSRQRA